MRPTFLLGLPLSVVTLLLACDLPSGPGSVSVPEFPGPESPVVTIVREGPAKKRIIPPCLKGIPDESLIPKDGGKC